MDLDGVYCCNEYGSDSYRWKKGNEGGLKVFYVTNNFVKKTYGTVRSFHPHTINEIILMMKEL